MKSYTGINIQYPISTLILNGSKIIETRTYPLPEKFKNIEMLIVETPGKNGKFKSRIVAKVIFSDSFKYKNKAEFKKDFKKHKVEEGTLWDWKEKEKWGWIIKKVVVFKMPVPLKKRPGIKYTNGLKI